MWLPREGLVCHPAPCHRHVRYVHVGPTYNNKQFLSPSSSPSPQPPNTHHLHPRQPLTSPVPHCLTSTAPHPRHLCLPRLRGWCGWGWWVLGGYGDGVEEREREKLFIIIDGTHMNISYVTMTRRRVAKQAFTWQRHRHSNGQTSLTVRPG